MLPWGGSRMEKLVVGAPRPGLSCSFHPRLSTRVLGQVDDLVRGEAAHQERVEDDLGAQTFESVLLGVGHLTGTDHGEMLWRTPELPGLSVADHVEGL